MSSMVGCLSFNPSLSAWAVSARITRSISLSRSRPPPPGPARSVEDDGPQHGGECRRVGRVRGSLDLRVAEHEPKTVAVGDRERRVDEDAAVQGLERAWLAADRDRLDRVRLRWARVGVSL